MKGDELGHALEGEIKTEQKQSAESRPRFSESTASSRSRAQESAKRLPSNSSRASTPVTTPTNASGRISRAHMGSTSHASGNAKAFGFSAIPNGNCTPPSAPQANAILSPDSPEFKVASPTSVPGCPYVSLNSEAFVIPSSSVAPLHPYLARSSSTNTYLAGRYSKRVGGAGNYRYNQKLPLSLLREQSKAASQESVVPPAQFSPPMSPQGLPYDSPLKSFEEQHLQPYDSTWTFTVPPRLAEPQASTTSQPPASPVLTPRALTPGDRKSVV